MLEALDDDGIIFEGDEDIEIVPDDADDFEEMEGTDAYGFTEEEVEELSASLLERISKAQQDEEFRLKEIETYRRQANAEPRSETKNFPMPNSSNLVPPLAMVHAQTMGAEIMNYFNVDPFWSFKPFREDDEVCLEESRLLTKYYSVITKSPVDLDFRGKLRDQSNEVALVGKIALHVPYLLSTYRLKKGETLSDVVLHNGPDVCLIPPEDISVPLGFSDLDRMPWISRRFMLTKEEVLAKQARGEWNGVDDIIDKPETLLDETKRNKYQANRQYIDRPSEDLYLFEEVYFYHDKDKDGYAEDHLWVIHKQSGKVMQKGLNELGMRPYAFGYYNKDSFMPEGKGTGKIVRMAQDEVETQHNLRIDNMKLTNMRMLEIERRTAMANGEEIFPGKKWLVDKIGSIREIRLSDVYPSTLNEEKELWHITAQATSMSEVKRGFSDPSLGQRDTFRGQQMRLNQSRGIFGTIVDGLTDCYKRVGLLMFLQLRNNADLVLDRERTLGRFNKREMGLLETLLKDPKYDFPTRFPLEIKVGEVPAQEGAQLQALQMGTQLYAMWAQQTAPIAQMVLGPQALQMMQQAPDVFKHFASVYVGSTKFLEKTLKLAGIPDYTLYTPDYSKLEMIVKQMEMGDRQAVKQMEEQSGVQSAGQTDFDRYGESGGAVQGSAQGAGEGFGSAEAEAGLGSEGQQGVPGPEGMGF